MIATTAGFAIMFGAGFYEILASAIAGFMSGVGVYGGKRAGVQSFLVNCIGAFFLAVTAILCIHYFPGTLNLTLLLSHPSCPLSLALQLQMRYMTRCMETIFPVRRGCSRHL